MFKVLFNQAVGLTPPRPSASLARKREPMRISRKPSMLRNILRLLTGRRY